MTVWAIVVAAGSGSRFGGPKQFEELGGRRLVDWAVAGARSVADGVVVVVPPGAETRLTRLSSAPLGVEAVVAGAASRSGSVRAGLAAVPAEADVIVVHDAARPLASPSLFAAAVAALAGGADGSIPALAVTDTVKQVRDGVVVRTLDRSDLVAVQTPQAFRAEALRRAHAASQEATDDAALVEAAGGRVVVIDGESTNTKITSRHDLLAAREAAGRLPAWS